MTAQVLILAMVCLLASLPIFPTPALDVPVQTPAPSHDPAAITPESYMDKYNALLESGAGEEAATAVLEEGMAVFPADKQLRLRLAWNYILMGEDEKGKANAKEALKYAPDSLYYSNLYMNYCDPFSNPEEAREAALRIIELCSKNLPSAGTVIDASTDYAIRDALDYTMNAYNCLMCITYNSKETELFNQYCKWVLDRKNDSVYGYKNGLCVYFDLATTYGEQKQFGDMERMLESYFELEQTAQGKGAEYQDAQIRLQKNTDIAHELYEVGKTCGDDFDVMAFVQEHFASTTSAPED